MHVKIVLLSSVMTMQYLWKTQQVTYFYDKHNYE